MKRNTSERTARGMWMALAICITGLLAACHNDTTLPPRLTEAQKADCGQKIAGQYGGTYIIDWADSSMPAHQNEEGKMTREMNREKVSDVTVSVTDYGLRSITFRGFPISMLSHVVDDEALREALASAPAINMTTRYGFALDTDYESVIWGMEDLTASFPLAYGGAEHAVLVTFRNSGVRWIIGSVKAEDYPSFGKVSALTLAVEKIYVDDVLVQTLDFYESTDMHIIFRPND